VEKAQAQVSQAQAALEQARVDLDRTVIRSYREWGSRT
jgi:multidrug resistance efflux pump